MNENGQFHDQFAELFVRHQNRIYGYILTLVPNHNDAEELFQETSLTIWRRWRDYNPDRPFMPWACGIAHNHVRNFVRKVARRANREFLSEDVLEQLARVRLEEDEDLAERQTALTRCLEELPEHQRDLVQRCYATKAKIRVVADDFGCTPNALYKLLGRVRRALYDCVSHRLELVREGTHG